MQNYKTTEHGELVRVLWVYDGDYCTHGSYALETSEETKAAEDEEIAKLESGEWAALRAIVEKRERKDLPWVERGSLWGIVVGGCEKELMEFAESSLDLGPEDDSKRGYATARDVERASEFHSIGDDINIDSDAKVSVADDGVWVQGWLWLANDNEGGGVCEWCSEPATCEMETPGGMLFSSCAKCKLEKGVK